MNKIRGLLVKRSLLWTVVLIIVFLTVVTVYAIMPVISMNSPTSFPVDI